MKTEKFKFLISLPQGFFQDMKKSFEGAHWDAKNYWNSVASLWNSTTIIPLTNSTVRGIAVFNIKKGKTNYLWKINKVAYLWEITKHGTDNS